MKESWRDFFIGTTRLMHLRDITHPSAKHHDSFICATHASAWQTNLSHILISSTYFQKRESCHAESHATQMTESWCDLFIGATRLMHLRDMTHSLAKHHDSFICATHASTWWKNLSCILISSTYLKKKNHVTQSRTSHRWKSRDVTFS